MKILAIKRRNPLVRAFSTKEWAVTVEEDNGEVKTYNAFAHGSVQFLLSDLEDEMGTAFTNDSLLLKHMKGEYIEGIEKVELAVEGKVVTKVNDSNIIVQVDTNRTAAQIQNQMRQSAQVQNGVGVRFGK